VIQNLRSALDHLAYELFMTETKGRYVGKHIYFPIEKEAKTYKKTSDRKTKGISNKAKRLIDSVKPYQGGNDTLWQIHELNIIDKHRLLVTVGSSYVSFDVGAHMHSMMKRSFPDQELPQFSVFLKPADKLFPLKAGDELFGTEPDAEEDPNMKLQFNIVLNEPGIIEGSPIVETLQTMTNEVDRLKDHFNHVLSI
jgi:hypothetical protein